MTVEEGHFTQLLAPVAADYWVKLNGDGREWLQNQGRKRMA